MEKQSKKSNTWSDRGLEYAREIDKKIFEGKGVEIIAGVPEISGVSYFSSKMPLLVIVDRNVRREISVEVSAVEHNEKDNDKLLHFLFRRTVEGSAS